MIDPDAALAFVGFVESRHEAWENRQGGLPTPWTSDPIVASRKFTNVFRAIDYGSQFLIRELLEPDLSPADVLARCFLYRHTNLPSAWRAYREEAGFYPTIDELDDLREFWKRYRGEGNQVFSGAYMIYPQSSTPGTDKSDSVISLTQRLFQEESEDNIVLDFYTQETQKERFGIFRQNKGVADFMSMQILTDWGYSEQCGEDLEDEFVVGGPGAVKGARALDREARTSDVILWARDAVYASPNCPEIHNGRKPSLMDIQNCLCEFSKYVRYASKPYPEKPYSPAHLGVQSTLVLPRHWN